MVSPRILPRKARPLRHQEHARSYLHHHLSLGSQTTAGTASSIEYVPPSSPRSRDFSRSLQGSPSQASSNRHGNLPRASAPSNTPPASSGLEATVELLPRLRRATLRRTAEYFLVMLPPRYPATDCCFFGTRPPFFRSGALRRSPSTMSTSAARSRS